MNNYVKFLILICIVLPETSVKCQSIAYDGVYKITPPSPDAAALGRYGEIPVDFMSGTPQICIPLWDIQVNDFTLPVNISYHSNSVLVSTIASSVGLGWVLNAGGAITRTVYDWPDEREQSILKFGYQGSIGRKINNGLDIYNDADFSLIDQEISRNKYDFEPDVFNYNFGKYSGQFVIDPDGNVNLLPKCGLEITCEKGTSSDFPIPHDYDYYGGEHIYSFTVRDEEGIIYKFNNFEITKTIPWSSENPPDWEPLDEIHLSAWYLSSIEFPNTSEKIIFTYYQGAMFYYTPVNMSKVYTELIEDLCRCTEREEYIIDEVSRCSVSGFTPILSKIETNSTRIKFNNSGGRWDTKTNYGTKIDSIEIFSLVSGSAKKVKTFVLNFDYFGNTSGTQGQSFEIYRLKLLNLKEKSGNSINKVYSFDYSPDIPVSITSHQIDHWGYYNGASGNDNSGGWRYGYLIPLETGDVGISSDRDPDSTVITNCLLKKITYPTGGSTSFEFGINHSIVGHPIGGGVRINKITSTSGDQNIIKKYSYSLGSYNGGRLSNYYYYKDRYVYFSQSGTTPCYNCADVWKDKIYSSNAYVTPGNVLYDLVIEYSDNSGTVGKTEYLYAGGDYGTPAEYPFVPVINKSYKKKLIEKKVFSTKNNEYVRVYQLINSYKTDANVSEIKGAKINVEILGFRHPEDANHHAIPPIHFIPVYYTYTSEWEYLSDTYEYFYDLNGQNEVEIETNYYYNNPKHYQISRVSVSQSKESINKTTYYLYPEDYSNNTGNTFINEMKTKHILNKPVEIYTLNNSDYALNGKLITYKTGNNAGLLDIEYNMEIPATGLKKYTPGQFYPSDFMGGFSINSYYKPDLNYDFYNSNGNLLQYHKTGDVNISFYWAYNYTYPIVKAINTTNSNLTNAVTNALIASGISNINQITIPSLNSTHRSQWITFNSNLRSALSNALITTYTYNPLVGMTSMTDEKGITTYYEYDNFGRLYRILDNDLNILKEYNYNYAH